MKAVHFITLALLGCGIILTCDSCQKPENSRPDILLFIADDMTWRDCEPYGNMDVKTPNLARLAEEGLCFDHMYSPTAMCGPARQALYTGMFPVKNGSYPNHAKVYDGTVSIVQHLSRLGYRVALIGKQHYAPEKSFPFEYLGGRNSDDGTGQDINLADAEAFINKDKTKPYFLVVATNQPHSPWNRGNPSNYDPDSITIPHYMVDTRLTREDLVDYYAEITYADSLLGYCLDMVEQHGNKENTLVMFASEQGSSLPFGKWTCYDAGIKAGFITRWPAKIKAGTRTDALAQYVDVVPTLYEAAGGNPSSLWGNEEKTMKLDGISFLPVLTAENTEHRKLVFGVQTTRGINNGSQNYPVRSVQNKTYKLIWNLNYKETFYCSGNTPRNKRYQEWLEAAADDPLLLSHVAKYRNRPEFELYKIADDPFELNNLVSSSIEFDSIMGELLTELKKWMKEQGDYGIATEWKALSRFKGDTIKWKAFRE